MVRAAARGQIAIIPLVIEDNTLNPTSLLVLSRVDYYVSNAHAQLANTTTPNAAGIANMYPPMPHTSFMVAQVSHLHGRTASA
jgi:hypothetical protein